MAGRLLLTAGSVAGVCLVLTSCSAPPGEGTPPAARFAAAAGWADEFAESSKTASPFEREILRDGVITPSELEDAQMRKRSCMLDGGYVYADHDDGTSEAEPAYGRRGKSSDQVHALLAACAQRFDRSVTYLFGEVRRNPDKLDEATIMVACLRESGVVGADYTERQWRADDDDGSWPYADFDPAVIQCRLDPLGLWRTP